MKHELDDVYDEVSSAKHQLISLLFTSKESSDIAINELHHQGYSKQDIKILTNEDLSKRPCLVRGETVDSDKVIVKKALLGIKIGAILGIVLSGIFILSMKYTAEPVLFQLLLIPVGAISGAVLGFLLGPSLPLDQHQYYKRKLIDGNVLIQFWIKEEKEIRHFKKMRWTICQLG